MSLDRSKIKEQAEKEVLAESQEVALKKVKGKMKEIKAAKQVVANLERELEDIYADIEEGIIT